MCYCNTDGLYQMPVIDDNCVNSIERTIAFDVRDWAEDRRLAWIYGIIFGWDFALDELRQKFNWTDADIERMEKYHMQWESCKAWLGEEKHNDNN